MVIYGLLFIGFYNVSNFFQAKSDVSNISTKHFKTKTQERLQLLDSFIARYPSALKAIASNPEFLNFIETTENRSEVENLFLTMKKSIICTVQVRYLDRQGNEIIRVDGTATGLKGLEQQSFITPVESLQNKFNRTYFQNFLKLKENEIGISFIELNKEFGEITLPKRPIIRIALPIYSNGKTQGILIINVCLKTFFKQLSKTTLYNIQLIDKQGNFILHEEATNSITGANFKEYTLIEEYGINEAQQILKNDSYLSDKFYSTVINNLNNEQKLKIILKLKHDELSNIAKENTNLMLWMMLLTVLLMLPVAVWLSRSPDALMKKLDHQAHIDELTLLPNRTSLFEDMKNNQTDIVVLMKIDDFAKLNNVYGYLLADELMKSLSNRLIALSKTYHFKAYTLPSNLFALTIDQKRGPFEALLNNIHRDIEKEIFTISDEHAFNINVTLGTSNPEQIKPIGQELVEAEIALRTAIDNKQDFYILEQKNDLEYQYKHNLDVLEVIRNAIQNNGVQCFYQPIYNNQKLKVDKYEVLMRITDENDILYPPHVFLEIAKSSKYYHRLTKSVIEQSFQFFKDKDYEFSINISSQDIEQPHFIDYLSEVIQEYNVCDQLVIEIVESESLGNYQTVYNFVKEIKKMGCKIAIDDFGSGYSNFEHILKLSEYIDYIKIDGSLIKNITKDETSFRVVKNIKTFSDDIGLKTIAEFVENEEIQNKITSLGIHYSQGYYFGKPHNELLIQTN